MRLYQLLPIVILTACQSGTNAENKFASIGNTSVKRVVATSKPANSDGEDDDAGIAHYAGDGENGSWLFEDKVDALSDVRTLKASTKIDGEIDDIHISVQCAVDTKDLTYELLGYHKDGSGAPVASKSSGSSAPPFLRMEYRIDDKQPRYTVANSPQYANQAIINHDQSRAMAAGSTVILRVQFQDALETYELNQGSLDFQKVVEPCQHGSQQTSNAYDEVDD